jgi:hypothetical protein
VAEIEEVFRRSRFNSYIDLDSRLSLLQSFRTNELLLALALTAQADVIISSDQDLLALDPWRGIPILTPAQFLSQFTIEADR